MKLTITIEEDQAGGVRVEQQAGAMPVPAGERAAEPAATDGGGPPEWLLAELAGGTPATAPATETGDMLDAGPAPASVDGAVALT